MSEFFAFSDKDFPNATTYSCRIRLDRVAAAYTSASHSYDKVTKTEEHERSLLSRLFKDWSRRTETVEVTEEVWYKSYSVTVADNLSTREKHTITIAKTRSKKEAEEMLAQLLAALEAS